MACCVWIGSDQCLIPTSDSELNKLLADVRAATGDDWRIREMTWTVRRWFRKPRVVRQYELLHHVHSGVEFQVINFYRPDREGGGSINIINDASHVAAYLYGILAVARDTADNKQGEQA